MRGGWGSHGEGSALCVHLVVNQPPLLQKRMNPETQVCFLFLRVSLICNRNTKYKYTNQHLSHCDAKYKLPCMSHCSLATITYWISQHIYSPRRLRATLNLADGAGAAKHPHAQHTSWQHTRPLWGCACRTLNWGIPVGSAGTCRSWSCGTPGNWKVRWRWHHLWGTPHQNNLMVMSECQPYSHFWRFGLVLPIKEFRQCTFLY